MNETAIVCLHGAGLNSSIWDNFIKEVKLDVLAIDFPNRMKSDTANKDLTFVDYVSSVSEQIKNWSNKDFVLVAHSISACVALQVAEKFKDRVKGFVAIASVIPQNGNSFASTLPFPQNFLTPIMLTILGTKPPASSTKEVLCNDLDGKQTKKIVEEFTAESKKLYTTKIRFSLLETKRVYIKTTNDKMPEKMQNEMAKNFEAHQVLEINSGHLPMISQPKDLARLINDIMKTTNR